ncbi:MAG TPA: DUF2255 family protein [Myxococcota bacterium]|nr:DUF2255 family protein [Myxococcota bacterium]
MGRIVKGFVIVVIVFVVLITALVEIAKFHDGPVGLIPGGALVAGELVAQPPADWNFAADVQEIEMQLAYEDSSRTTWVLVKDGVAYIPCSLKFPPGKRWYKAADQKGEAVVRIGGKRYPVTLTRVKDDALATEIGKVAVAKYPAAARSAGSEVWFFKIEPRTAAG